MYIIKTGLTPYVSELKRVLYKRVSKPTGESIFGMRVLRSTGELDKNALEIVPEKSNGFYVKTERDSIRRLIRRLRDGEAEELAAIDAEMKALHRRKAELLQRAWEKGNVVTVKELVDRAE